MLTDLIRPHDPRWREALRAVRHDVYDLPEYLTLCAAAEAAHRVFGFSRFQLMACGRQYTIGRLAEHWFRIHDGELLGQPDTLRGLLAAEPRREIWRSGEKPC